ncbi:hypothetical protein AGMMS50218_04740 [Actinomycetota bacterium]|nr:hypothetical protein AGMMS50218_04740 [Actinomycetota bacterium]
MSTADLHRAALDARAATQRRNDSLPRWGAIGSSTSTLVVDGWVRGDPAWDQVAEHPPPGDPDAVGRAGDEIRSTSDRLAEMIERLRTAGVAGLSGVLTGHTGASAAEALEALATLTSVQSEGLSTAERALGAYERALRDARRQHRRGADQVRDGASVVRSAGGLAQLVCRVPPLDPTALAARRELLADTVARVRSGLEEVTDGLALCARAYEDALDAGAQLRRGLDDARSSARISRVARPDGQSALDFAVARTVMAGDDPDTAVLSDDEWRRYLVVWEAMAPGERRQFVAALAESGAAENGALIRALLISALSTGAPLAAVLALGAELRGMDGVALNEIASLRIAKVAEEVRPPGEAAVSAGRQLVEQYSDTTCGPTSLIALAVQSDPFIAYWLATGALLHGHVPAYLAGLNLAGVPKGARDTQVASRIAHLENAVKNRVNDLPGTWVPVYPGVFGSSPGGVARDATLTGVPYAVDWTADNSLSTAIKGLRWTGAGVVDVATSLDAAARAVNTGAPVLLLVGKDAYPQHYVLLTGYHDGEFTVYEPGRGTTGTVTAAALASDAVKPIPILGNYWQVYAVLVPSRP